VEIFEQSRKPGQRTVNVEDFEDKNEGYGRIKIRVCRVITAKNEEKIKVSVFTKWSEIYAIIEMHSTSIIFN